MSKYCEICKGVESLYYCYDKQKFYCNDCHAYLRKAKVCNAYEHIKGCDFCGVLDNRLLILKKGKFKNNCICRQCLSDGVV